MLDLEYSNISSVHAKPKGKAGNWVFWTWRNMTKLSCMVSAKQIRIWKFRRLLEKDALLKRESHNWWTMGNDRLERKRRFWVILRVADSFV